MCGIIGYSGPRPAAPFLVQALRRLEYRGYDSAGVATLHGGVLHLRRRVGRIAELTSLLHEQPVPGLCGIGHTRWATHGGVTEANAHPHVGGNGLVAVVHNGVIENYAQLRRRLVVQGCQFQGETDTEVIAHLIALNYQGDLVESILKTLPLLTGTYGLAVISPHHPDCIVAARLGSPLVVGVGQGESFVASDAAALVGHTNQVVDLDDHQLCVLTPERWQILDRDQARVQMPVREVTHTPADVEKNGYEHFMLKEIHEQPEALENALRGRLDETNATAKFGGLNLEPGMLRQTDQVLFLACGTSYHAALVGAQLLEELARLHVQVEYASEFRYRNLPMDRHTVAIVISQSGETADTLAALREAKRKGCPSLALCNVVGSTIAREADGGIYLHAGIEIGVASTKAFTSQVATLVLLALYLGRLRHLSHVEGARIIQDLRALPQALRRTLACHARVRRIAEKYVQATSFLYLGRQYLHPIALEGALKLKEISYVHAEGFPAGEMKHGPIALIDAATPSVFLTPRNAVYEKVLSNLEEVRSRQGPVIAIATEGDEWLPTKTEDVIFIPPVPDYLQPLIAIVPLQLLAYEIARLKGCDIDKPRNLAKSVTVE